MYFELNCINASNMLSIIYEIIEDNPSLNSLLLIFLGKTLLSPNTRTHFIFSLILSLSCHYYHVSMIISYILRSAMKNS